jgi:hypothetical protein
MRSCALARLPYSVRRSGSLGGERARAIPSLERSGRLAKR